MERQACRVIGTGIPGALGRQVHGVIRVVWWVGKYCGRLVTMDELVSPAFRMIENTDECNS